MGLIPISRVVLGDEEIEGVVKVLRSGALRQGQVCAAFEQAFARTVGGVAVSCSSGTAALHLAYWAVLNPGDEVLVPAFTFAATATAAVACGAVPVFVDVDPDTLLIDVEDAARKVTSRTRAIAPVHLYGNACDVDRLLSLARAHGLVTIWDAAQAHLTRYRGADVGSYPDMVCYSFYPTKNMTTGEGGMVVTNDESLVHRLRLLRSHGTAGKYNHVMFGLNYRMTDIAAAIGLAQLEKLPASVRRRREHAAYLASRLQAVPGVRLLKTTPEAEHSYHLFTILLDLERLKGSRDEFQKRLRDLDVESAVHYPLPLHRQPIFAERCRDAHCPNAELAAAAVCSVPVHPFLSRDELERVADAVIRVVTEMA